MRASKHTVRPVIMASKLSKDWKSRTLSKNINLIMQIFDKPIRNILLMELLFWKGYSLLGCRKNNLYDAITNYKGLTIIVQFAKCIDNVVWWDERGKERKVFGCVSVGGIPAAGSLGGVQSSEAKLSKTPDIETRAHLCLRHLMSIFHTLQTSRRNISTILGASNRLKGSLLNIWEQQ